MAGTGLGTPYDLRESRALTTSRIPGQTGIEHRPDLTPQRAATAWNLRHPIGTAVYAWPGARPEGRRLTTHTRTPAWLVGGVAVVSVDGCPGGIALDHIEVRDEDGAA